MVRRGFLLIGLTLVVGGQARAQTEEIPVTDQDLAAHRVPQQGYPPLPAGPAGEDYSRPLPDYPDPMGEPPWCDSPYKHTSVRIGIGYNPTTSRITDGNAGYSTDDIVATSRLMVDYERPNGIGYRVEYWDYDVRVRFPWGPVVKTEASTLYLEVSDRFYVDDLEVKYGGGLAAARFQIGRSSNQFIGIGPSIFGEGFYPFLRYAKTDLGLTGHARLAVVGAIEDDVIHDRVAAIDDIGWGLELRHRFGAHEEKYWYITALREIQYWTGSSNFLSADEVFQGESFKFGMAW